LKTDDAFGRGGGKPKLIGGKLDNALAGRAHHRRDIVDPHIVSLPQVQLALSRRDCHRNGMREESLV
jgi:hypothetical protein